MASALATRLVVAGVSGSTFLYINNHVNIAIMYVDQINEHSVSDSDSDSDCLQSSRKQ